MGLPRAWESVFVQSELVFCRTFIIFSATTRPRILKGPHIEKETFTPPKFSEKLRRSGAPMLVQESISKHVLWSL